MGMTLQELRNEVRENIHRPAEGFSDDRVDTRLNWAQDEIGGLHTFKEMKRVFTRDTVASQKRYGFPERMKEIVSLVLEDGTNSRKLRYYRSREADMDVPYPEDDLENIPVVWVDYGTNFELGPIPNDAYGMILRAGIFVSDFALDSDESGLLRKDSLIVAVATRLCFYALRELEDAEYWARTEVARLFVEAIGKDDSTKDWNPVARPFTLQGSTYRDYRSPFA